MRVTWRVKMISRMLFSDPLYMLDIEYKSNMQCHITSFFINFLPLRVSFFFNVPSQYFFLRWSTAYLTFWTCVRPVNHPIWWKYIASLKQLVKLVTNFLSWCNDWVNLLSLWNFWNRLLVAVCEFLHLHPSVNVVQFGWFSCGFGALSRATHKPNPTDHTTQPRKGQKGWFQLATTVGFGFSDILDYRSGVPDFF